MNETLIQGKQKLGLPASLPPAPREDCEMPAQLERDWEGFTLGKSPKVCTAGGVINGSFTLTSVKATDV